MYAINCSTQIVTDESTNISGTAFPHRYSNMFMAHVNAKCQSRSLMRTELKSCVNIKTSINFVVMYFMIETLAKDRCLILLFEITLNF